jgi:hypothetical protein
MTSPEIFKIEAEYVRAEGPAYRAEYLDGTPALFVGDTKLSVCLTDYDLRPPPNCVFIPTYSESAGLPAAIEAAGLAIPVEEVPFGPFDATAMVMRVTGPWADLPHVKERD